MTREELDFIGSMNMCDEISNEAYKKIVCHCDETIPCEDVISRQAVLDWIEHFNSDGLGTVFIDYEHGKKFEKYIKKIPSVNPIKTGHWIPVNERLPEDGQSVLFCDIDNDIMVGYHVKGRPNTHFSQDGTYEDMKNVIAWMSLPKPYAPQESEE